MSLTEGSGSFLKSYAGAGCLALLSLVLLVAGALCLTYALTMTEEGSERAEGAASPAEGSATGGDVPPVPPPAPPPAAATETSSAPPELAPTPQPQDAPPTEVAAPPAARPSPPPSDDDEPAETSGEEGGFLQKMREIANEAKKKAGERRAASRGGPADGEFNCFVNAGSTKQIFVQKFSIDGNSYTDLSFQKGSGRFRFDPADGSMTFTSGPFEEKYLGVFVAKGDAIKRSKRFHYPYEPQPTKADVIYLLDPKTDYSKKIVFGIYCSRN